MGPFPFEEAYKAGRGKDWDRFHACLTLCLADIAGIASHGKQLTRITPERQLEFQVMAARSFFAKFPEFHSIEKRIQGPGAPALKRLLESTEQARLLIVEALGEPLQK